MEWVTKIGSRERKPWLLLIKSENPWPVRSSLKEFEIDSRYRRGRRYHYESREVVIDERCSWDPTPQEGPYQSGRRWPVPGRSRRRGQIRARRTWLELGRPAQNAGWPDSISSNSRGFGQ